MSRKITFAALVVAVLLAALPSTVFAQGPYCQPNDQWCQAAQRANQWGQQAQQRLQQDWGRASYDLTGYNDFSGQVYRGAQQFGNDMNTVRTRVYNSGYFGR